MEEVELLGIRRSLGIHHGLSWQAFEFRVVEIFAAYTRYIKQSLKHITLNEHIDISHTYAHTEIIT